MNSNEIFIKNNRYLDEHFCEQRIQLYSKRISPEEVSKENAIKMAKEFWLELNHYPLPESFSDEEMVKIFLDFFPKVLEQRRLKPPFNFYKKYDLKELKENILSLSEKYWDVVFKSLNIANPPIHKRTQVLGNTVFLLDYNGNGNIEVFKSNFIPKNIQLKVDEIISDLENFVNGKVLISGFTRLKAGNNIGFHSDAFYYFSIVRRFQIAVYTNPRVFFNIGKETKVFEEGDCYEINNLIPHSIQNHGETDRINLLVDILPMDKIKTYKLYC